METREPSIEFNLNANIEPRWAISPNEDLPCTYAFQLPEDGSRDGSLSFTNPSPTPWGRSGSRNYASPVIIRIEKQT